jgi:hypothetical protein
MARFIRPYVGTTYVAEAIPNTSPKLQSHDHSGKRGTTSTTVRVTPFQGPTRYRSLIQDVRFLIFNYDTKEDVAVFSVATEIRLLPTSATGGFTSRFELNLSSFSRRRFTHAS